MVPIGKKITPWFHGWNVLAVGIFTVAMCVGVVNFSFTFYVVRWVEEFDTSRSVAMLALSAGQIVAGLLLPFTGRAMDRLPIRWLASGGALLLGLAFILVSYAQSIIHIIILYGIFIAAAESLAGPLVAQTLAAKWFRGRRGFAIGLAALGTSVGGFILPPIVAYFLVQYGWRTAHLYIAGIVVLTTIPLLLLVVKGAPAAEDDAPTSSAARPAPQVPTDRSWTTREILRTRYFWFVVVAFLPLMEMTTALLSNLALWTKDLGIDTQRTAFLMSILSLMMISGKITFGYLADRFDMRLLCFGGAAMLCTALIMMVGKPSYPLLIVIIVMIGLSAGGQLPLAGAMIGRYFGPLSFGSVMGLFYLCIRPVAFGGPIGGWVRDRFGSYDYFWLGGLA
ncbi:MAG: MFS transporter, partial [Chloroflexota bacterium]